MKTEELKAILDKHLLWLNNKDGGDRANLSYTNLYGANLSYTNLYGANLSYTNLYGANLSYADLSYANLSYANLSYANLSYADLSCANLSYADLSYANLICANLSYANLICAILPDNIPYVDKLHTKILQAVTSGLLDMSNWHTCETTHCRAGWAITIAGKQGKELETMYGPSIAGTLIYVKAYPNQPVPSFYCNNEIAMEDIKRCAKMEEQVTTT